MASTLEFTLASKKNVGKSKNEKMPKLFKYGIIVPDSFEFADADIDDAASLKTKLETTIKAAEQSRGYLLPPFHKCEDLSEETVYEDSPLSVNDVRDGQYRMRIHIAKNMFTHKALNSHYYKNEGRILLFDLENKMLVTEKSNGKKTGFSMALLKPEKMNVSDGSDSSTSPMYLCLADNKEWDESGRLYDGSVIREIDPLTDVKIELLDGDAFSDAGFIVKVTNESDGTPISGLLVADFQFPKADGITLQSIATAAEDANNPGQYNLIPTTVFETGTAKLRAASALTVSPYENPTRLNLAVVIV